MSGFKPIIDMEVTAITDPNEVSSNSGRSTREVISSRTLFAGRSQVVIEHLGEQYILRITKQGKLILNK